MDERRRLQFAAWSGVVGVAAAILAVALLVADYTVEGTLFGLLCIVFLYVAVAGLLDRWPFGAPRP